MGHSFDLEAEMRDLVARRAITDVVHRYMRGLDRLDPVLHRSCFHDDAFVDTGLMHGNADEFTAFAQDFLGTMDGSQHFLGQVSIEIHDQERASGECYFQAWHGTRDDEGKPRDLFIAGRYIDEYTCKNGEWKIWRRHLIVDWVRDDPADHDFYAANPATNRAGRGGQDFSQHRRWPI